MTPTELERAMGFSRQYAAKKIQEGCPTDSLEHARQWFVKNASYGVAERESEFAGCSLWFGGPRMQCGLLGDKLMFDLAHREHRAGRVPHNPLGGTAHKYTLDPSVAMRAFFAYSSSRAVIGSTGIICPIGRYVISPGYGSGSITCSNISFAPNCLANGTAYLNAFSDISEKSSGTKIFSSFRTEGTRLIVRAAGPRSGDICSIGWAAFSVSKMVLIMKAPS